MNGISSAAEAGRVQINKTRVSTRRTPDGLLVFHTPSARVVRLEQDGEKIWAKLESGTESISQLVSEHQHETGMSAEAAAFRVIGFLDELRAEDFVKFSMPGAAAKPFLDVTLDSPAPLEFQRPVDDEVAAQAQGKPEVTLRAARPTLTVAEVTKLAAAELDVRIDTVHRLRMLDLEPDEVSGRVARKIATRDLTPESRRERRLLELERPELDLSLAALQDQQLSGSGGTRQVSRRIIVIIIITDGPIIIIVIDGGPGPTFGRSRNACKTVCV